MPQTTGSAASLIDAPRDPASPNNDDEKMRIMFQLMSMISPQSFLMKQQQPPLSSGGPQPLNPFLPSPASVATVAPQQKPLPGFSVAPESKSSRPNVPPPPGFSKVKVSASEASGDDPGDIGKNVLVSSLIKRLADWCEFYISFLWVF